MLPTYESFATSSFLLYLDNRICSNGGFNNVSTLAYPINQTVNGYNVYALPFGTIMYDTGISGVIPLTGVYINNSFISVGQSGLSGISFDKSQLYFDPNNSPVIHSISGSYSIKEVNAVLASFPDITFLFETKLGIRNKVQMLPTGLNNNILTYPAFFLENASAPTNKPWMLGGIDQTRTVFNIYFFGDSLYQKTNFISLCKDMAWKYVPLIDNVSDFPLNNLGYYKNNIPYSYSNLTANKIASGKAMLVEDVTVTEYGKRGITSEIESMTTESFFTLITVTAWTARKTN